MILGSIKALSRRVLIQFFQRPTDYIFYSSSCSDRLAVLLYKVVNPEKAHFHSNNQEVICWVDSLKQEGYNVLVINRGCQEVPEEILSKFAHVSLLIGIDAVRSGRHYEYFLKELKPKASILILTTQAPKVWNSEISRRESRSPCYSRLLSRGLLTDAEIACFERVATSVNLIALPGNAVDSKSYLQSLGVGCDLIFDLNWSTLNAVTRIDHLRKNPPEISMVCGHDAYLKGLDIAIELATKLPYKLHLMTPNKDLALKLIHRSGVGEKVICHGYVPMNHPRFSRILSQCSYFLALSATEGMPTSALHCLKAGLIPISTTSSHLPQTGIGIYDLEVNTNDLSNASSRIRTYIDSKDLESLDESSKQLVEYISKNHTIANYRNQVLKLIRLSSVHF